MRIVFRYTLPGILLAVPAVYADAPVMANPCPFNCASAGIPVEHCRNWREGSTCFVQDLRNDPDYSARGRFDPDSQRGDYHDRGYGRGHGPTDERRQPSVGDSVGDAIDRAIDR